MKEKENKSIFLEVFGDTPQLRIYDFLIDNHFFDFPLTEIAKGANVSYKSLQKIFPEMIGLGIVKKTRRIGKSDYYQPNINHPFFRRLINIDWMLSKASADRKYGKKNTSVAEAKPGTRFAGYS